MKRFTNKELRMIAKANNDVTNKPFRSAIPEPYTQIGYSAGVYGCTGLLLRGESGALYVVTKRTPALWFFS